MDKQMTIDIGIDANKREEIANGLSRVLADTYTLYLKTHNFHWNVTGPMFQALHLMFETQYNELALAVDAVAERIRALGFPAPGTYKQFLQLSSIKDEDSMPTAQVRAFRAVSRFVWLGIHGRYQPSALSSAIITVKPPRKPIVAMSTEPERTVSGMSSSTTTYSIAPAAAAIPSGRKVADVSASAAPMTPATGSIAAEN
jgi:Ferritin-like domain